MRLIYPHSVAAQSVTLPPGRWGGAPAFLAPDAIIREAAPDPGVERSKPCALVRDLFGNPFRVRGPDPSWWAREVVALARSIHDDRGFDRMPGRGDALEEAGCTRDELLARCREPGEHARECWALEIILARS